MQLIEPQAINIPFNLGIVTSRFNQEITEMLYQGATERLDEKGFPTDNITSVWVPGAVEIPIIAANLARKAEYAVIIALGAVIRGETSHYDYVCEQVSQGCQRVSFEFDVPVIFGVLTTENMQQAQDRVGGAHGHKGKEAADAAMDIVSVLRQIDKL